MRVINSRVHRVLDFVTVAGFVVAPTALGLSGLPANLAYILAVVHLGLTLATDFSRAGARPVSLVLHGGVEGVVGLALVALPWLLSWDGPARTFYVGRCRDSARVGLVRLWGGGIAGSCLTSACSWRALQFKGT